MTLDVVFMTTHSPNMPKIYAPKNTVRLMFFNVSSSMPLYLDLQKHNKGGNTPHEYSYPIVARYLVDIEYLWLMVDNHSWLEVSAEK